VKIRRGFVSNSSSSSFIVVFPRGFVRTPENIHAYLFGQAPGTLAHPFSTGTDDLISTTQAAQMIAAQMHRQPANSRAAIERAANGWIPGLPDMDDFCKSGGREIDWSAWESACQVIRRQFVEKINHDLAPQGDLFVFSWEDHDQAGSIMETGVAFKRVAHVGISHH
jgi:hypothetical protein